MSEQTKCLTLNEAIVAYREGLNAIDGGAGHDKKSPKLDAFVVDKYLELERALNYNLGVAYWHLGQIERRKVTKI